MYVHTYVLAALSPVTLSLRKDFAQCEKRLQLSGGGDTTVMSRTKQKGIVVWAEGCGGVGLRGVEVWG